MDFFNSFYNSFAPDEPGFIFMWVLVGVGVSAAILVFFKWLQLGRIGDTDSGKFTFAVKKHIEEGRSDQAAALCRSGGKRLLPAVLSSVVGKAGDEPEIIQARMEESTIGAIPLIENKLSTIAMISNIATLIGLMGTIYGLILSFAAVGDASIQPAMKSAKLAEGISTAMNTTLFGLIISIPCILAYSFFRSKADSIINNIDEACVSVMGALVPDIILEKDYSPSSAKHRAEVDTEPNIAPMMNLMVILIPLLLTQAEFTKMGSIEINLPSAGGASESESPRPPSEEAKLLNLTVTVLKDGFNVNSFFASDKNSSEGETSGPMIPLKQDGSYDFAKLNSTLREIKTLALKDLLSPLSGGGLPQNIFSLSALYQKTKRQREFFHYKDIETVKIVSDFKIKYQTIVDVMDASRIYKQQAGNAVRRAPLFPVVSLGVVQ
ncbi:MAG: MotA/TolQ/ExbB proton channel family protein [Fibrobacterota bacterium]